MELREFPGVLLSLTTSANMPCFGFSSDIPGTSAAQIDAAYFAARDWCQDQFGDKGWIAIPTRIWFLDPTMATAFRVRWC